MTGKETLYMYARLRGINTSQIAKVVDDLIQALLLTEHADKLVQAYRYEQWGLYSTIIYKKILSIVLQPIRVALKVT